jgi:Lsr2
MAYMYGHPHIPSDRSIEVASVTNVTLVDDIDGSEAVDTVSFGLDGTEYEIDLNDEHIDELRGGLMPYIKAARKVGAGPSRRQTSAVPKRSRRDLAETGRGWLGTATR